MLYNNEHKLSSNRFAETLNPGSDDFVWAGILVRDYRYEKHTEAEWRNIIAQLKSQPV